MAKYKLEIYKIPSVEVVLQSYQAVHKNNSLIMAFTDSSQLQKGDLIWAESDMAQNDTHQMLVVKAVMPSGKVRLKRPEGEESLLGLRSFEKEEKFKVVASFIPVYEEIKTNSIPGSNGAKSERNPESNIR